MKEILTLLLGAVGAIIAIFAKEAVQQALQRRVIAWQLFGYLLSWKSTIVKEGPLLTLYMAIEAEEKQITESLSKGAAELRAQLAKRNQKQIDIRKKIKDSIEAALKNNAEAKFDQSTLMLLESGAFGISQSRALLVDSKTFISDRDAAILGRQVSIHAIQFRTALLAILGAFEGGLKMATLEGEQRTAVFTYLVDQVVVQGEGAFVAFIRLEQYVDQITRRTIPQITWDILRGK